MVARILPPGSVMLLRHAVVLCTVAVSMGLAGCGAGGEGPGLAASVRDTTAAGVPRITHLTLGDQMPDTLRGDLRIGTLDGEAPTVFGDIRGIEAGDDGTIYVVDAQAVELRAFGEDGTFRSVIAGPGEGPGELGATNGLVRSADGTLWVHDHRKMLMQGYSPAGEFLTTSGVPVRSWSYVYSGGVDREGRFWKFDSNSDAGPRDRRDGLNETTSRSFMTSFDPAGETRDSVYLGDTSSRFWVVNHGNGQSLLGIPHTAGARPVFDPLGGFWAVDAPEYRVIHVDAEGDTVRVLRGELPPIPVTEADRDAYTAVFAERSPEMGRAVQELWEHVPAEKPRAAGVFLDDQGRVWVRRGTAGDAEAEQPVYDVYRADGDWLATLTTDFVPWTPLNPVVRNGFFYAVEKDELEVARVVRAPLPGSLR